MNFPSIISTMLHHLRARLNVVLLPHGDDVWQSRRYRAVADTLDTWSFWCTIINNILIVKAAYRSAHWDRIGSSQPDFCCADGR
jgi:hypothetical protein